MKEGYRVHFGRDMHTDSLIMLIKRVQNGKIYVANPIELTFREKKECEVLDPTLKICLDESDDFLEAIRNGLEGKSLDDIKGELDATKNHLEDMRKIVYKKDYKKIGE